MTTPCGIAHPDSVNSHSKMIAKDQICSILFMECTPFLWAQKKTNKPSFHDMDSLPDGKSQGEFLSQWQ
jgi:hypothetical protein